MGKITKPKREWGEYTPEERRQMAGSNSMSRQWVKFNRIVNEELKRRRMNNATR